MEGYYHYFVEGETERAIINALKKRIPPYVEPGKVDVLNLTQQKITDMHLRVLKKRTIIVIVFDTDVVDTGILNYNIKKIQSCSNVKKVICIPQYKNLEDELISCTDIRSIKQLLGSKSNSDFKSDLIKEIHLVEKLEKHNFSIELLWNNQPIDEFGWIKNDSMKIKKNTKK